MEDIIVRLAKENRRWGYGKIEGEILKLGFNVSPLQFEMFWMATGHFRLGLMSLQANFGAWSTHYKQELACHERRIF